MREFIKGWRRKAGVVTLGVACLLLAVSIRSFFITDVINFTYRDRAYFVCSDRGSIEYHCLYCQTKVSWKHPVTLTGSNNALIAKVELTMEREVMAAKALLEEIKRNDDERDRVPVDTLKARSKPLENSSVVPLWSIILPLTAASAWLLLRKFEPSLDADRARLAQPLNDRGEGDGSNERQVS